MAGQHAAKHRGKVGLSDPAHSARKVIAATAGFCAQSMKSKKCAKTYHLGLHNKFGRAVMPRL
jgi:hypothetical protein